MNTDRPKAFLASFEILASFLSTFEKIQMSRRKIAALLPAAFDQSSTFLSRLTTSRISSSLKERTKQYGNYRMLKGSYSGTFLTH